MEQEIREFVSNLKTKYRLMPYVYNDDSSFVPGNPVYYSGPYWDEDEVSLAINSLLGGTWISAGENVREFEKQFSKRINQLGGVMVNSGSSANLVMIAALKKYFNWEDGDEIIVSVVGFPTTVAPIIQNNLKAKFVDIEMETLNFDLNQIERIISDKTKAIFLSPVLGNPPNIRHLEFICKKFNLQLILDSCDTLGTLWEGKHLNEFAVASSFSFYPAHHMSCSFNTRIPYMLGSEILFDSIENIFNKFSLFPNKIKILSFDASGGVFWTPPSAIIRHEKPENKRMFRITSEHGKSVDVTEDHSIFVLDNDLRIVAKKACEISLDDFIVGASRVPPILASAKSFDLVKEFSSREIRMFVSGFPTRVLTNVKNADYRSAYKVRDSLPAEFLTEYTEEELEKISIGIPQCKHKIPAKLEITEELARFVGYYMAEGSYSDGGINISLNENEKDIIEDIEIIAKNLFGLSTRITVCPNSKGINVAIDSITLKRLLRDIFGITTGAKNKRIPSFLFAATENVIKSFIYGYTSGDGSNRRGINNSNYIDVTSVSKELLNDFQFMLSLVGISASFFRRNKANSRLIANRIACGGENFTLKFSGFVYDVENKTVILSNKTRKSMLTERVPVIGEIKKFLKGKVGTNNKYITKERLQNFCKKYNKNLPEFLFSDLMFMHVRSVEEIEYLSKYVYDFSVPGYENFYGGHLGMFLHNTTIEGGMVTSNNREILDLTRSFATWGRGCFCQSTQNLLPNGMCKKRFSKWLPNYNGIVDHKYVFENMGYNLKPTDMQGAVGLAQLKKLDEIIQKRKVSRETITKYFSKLSVTFPKVLIGADVSWFGTPIICKNKEQKDKLVSYLEKNKIQTRNYFAGNLLLHPGFEHLDDFRKYPNANLVLDLVFFVGAAPHYGKNIFSYFEKVIEGYDGD